MKLSVCCITYNHGQFIAQALDGFFMQQTKFNFEIIISDDCSSDNTRAICIDYQQKYPGKIKLVLREKNIGMMQNFAYALENCSGDYIALCEGDDYWIDPDKLQKQVDFLENNLNYSICFHRVYELIQNKQIPSDLNLDEIEKDYSIHDLALGNFIHTPSVVFRRNFFHQFPSWYLSSPMGDYLLYMIVAKSGPIKYFPQLMSVYRQHNNGIWSAVSHQTRAEKTMWLINKLMEGDFSEEVKLQLSMHMATLKNIILRSLLKEPDLDKFLQILGQYSHSDAEVTKAWLFRFYPEYINSLRSKIKKLEDRNTIAGITSRAILKMKSTLSKRK